MNVKIILVGFILISIVGYIYFDENEHSDTYYDNGVLKSTGNLHNGYGKFYSETGFLIYEGYWNNSKFQGQGILYYDDGYVNGTFDQGLLYGYAESYYGDGSKMYFGESIAGKYSGYGELYARNGQLIYQGYWNDSKFQGKGKLYYSNGNLLYDGYFKSAKYDGKGSLYFENGSLKYSGEFVEGIYVYS